MRQIRRRAGPAVAFVALLLVPAATLTAPASAIGDAPVPSADGLAARGPILIEGDDQFTAENGVRRGSGTADDPYVISHWTFIPDEVLTSRPTITLEGTSAHVVVENVRFAGATPNVGLYGASNATVRDRVAGFNVHGSRDVVLNVPTNPTVLITSSQRVTVHGRGPDLPLPNGLDDPDVQRFFAAATSDLHIDGLHMESEHVFGSGQAGLIQIANVDGLVLKDTFLHPVHGNSAIFVHGDLRDAVLYNVTGLHGGLEMWLAEEFDRLALVDTRWIDPAPYHGITHIWRAEDVLVCGTTMRGGDQVQIGAAHAVVVANSLDGTRGGLSSLWFQSGRVERNRVEPVYAGGVFGDGVTVRNNSFLPPSTGSEEPVPYRLYNADVRWNWWGDASGPSGEWPGTGAPLAKYVASGENLVAPWLTEPPTHVGPGSVDCDAELAAWQARGASG